MPEFFSEYGALIVKALKYYEGGGGVQTWNTATKLKMVEI